MRTKAYGLTMGDGLGYYDALLGDGRELPEVDDCGVVQEIRQGKQVYIYSSLFLSFFLSVGRDGKRPESGQFLLFCSFFFVFGSMVSSGETAETTQSLVYSSWGAGRRRLVTPPLGR